MPNTRKKELSTNRRGIVHTMLTLLLMSSSSAFCVFGLACISTTATTIHFFALQFFFLFFVNSCICKTAVWCCLFFYAHYSFFLYFFSRLLFTYFLANHRARSFWTIHFFAHSSSKIWRLFFGIVFTFFFCSTFRMLYTGVASDSHCSVLRLLFMFMWLFSVFHFTFTLFRCRNFVCCFHWWCVLVSFTHYSFLLSVCSTIRFAVVP